MSAPRNPGALRPGRAAAEQEDRLGTGFRILPRQRAAGPERVARFPPVPVANASDLMARIPAVEQAWGQDRIATAHRHVGMWSFSLMVGHIVLISPGSAATGPLGHRNIVV